MKNEKIEQMKQLVEQLNKYRDEYYNNSNPSVSDQEYDNLYDKLVELEKETGVYMSNSPTQSVGYEVKSELVKIKHNHPMLSLDKTKSVTDIVEFFKPYFAVLEQFSGLLVLIFRAVAAAEKVGEVVDAPEENVLCLAVHFVFIGNFVVKGG